MFSHCYQNSNNNTRPLKKFEIGNYLLSAVLLLKKKKENADYLKLTENFCAVCEEAK